jgi:DNA repair protein RadC
MITLKTFERTPALAELKVTYRRGRPRDDRQEKMPWVVCTPVACEKYLRTIWDKDTIDLREEFVVVCLNGSNEVLGWVKLHTGGLDHAMVDSRLVFGVALQTASAAIVVAHNHPTGNISPSEADRITTRRLRDGARLLGIRLLDHIIVNRDGYFSFAEAGEC